MTKTSGSPDVVYSWQNWHRALRAACSADRAALEASQDERPAVCAARRQAWDAAADAEDGVTAATARHGDRGFEKLAELRARDGECPL